MRSEARYHWRIPGLEAVDSAHGARGELLLADLVAADLGVVALEPETGAGGDAEEPGGGKFNGRHDVVVDEPARARLDVGGVLAVRQGGEVDALCLADAELGHRPDPAGDTVAE